MSGGRGRRRGYYQQSDGRQSRNQERQQRQYEEQHKVPDSAYPESFCAVVENQNTYKSWFGNKNNKSSFCVRKSMELNQRIRESGYFVHSQISKNEMFEKRTPYLYYGTPFPNQLKREKHFTSKENENRHKYKNENKYDDDDNDNDNNDDDEYNDDYNQDVQDKDKKSDDEDENEDENDSVDDLSLHESVDSEGELEYENNQDDDMGADDEDDKLD